MITCCKDCKERVAEPNCHSTCEKYLKYKEERIKLSRIIVGEKINESVINKIHRKSLKKKPTNKVIKSKKR